VIYRNIFEYYDISKKSIYFLDDMMRYVNIENDISIFLIYAIIINMRVKELWKQCWRMVT